MNFIVKLLISLPVYLLNCLISRTHLLELSSSQTQLILDLSVLVFLCSCVLYSLQTPISTTHSGEYTPMFYCFVVDNIISLGWVLISKQKYYNISMKTICLLILKDSNVKFDTLLI